MTTSAPAIAVQPGHVGLNVSDLDRSRDFYTQVLDLEALGASKDPGREWVYLGRDGAAVLTLWRQADGGFAAGSAGLHHLALRVDSVADLMRLQQRLADLGIERRYGGAVLHAEGADSGGIYFTDPDGIRLEVFVASGLADEGVKAPADAPSCGHF